MATTKWSLDPAHSELGFKVKHLMISNVSGSFSRFEANAVTSGDDFLTAKIEATIDVNSISTNNAQRDSHLLNSDFFEVEAHPRIVFTSNRIERRDDENYFIHGQLTMKGVSKPVKLLAEYSGLAKDPWGNLKAGFTISGKINREEFGISFNAPLETGGLVLGTEVKIHGEIQLVREVVLAEAEV